MIAGDVRTCAQGGCARLRGRAFLRGETSLRVITVATSIKQSRLWWKFNARFCHCNSAGLLFGADPPRMGCWHTAAFHTVTEEGRSACQRSVVLVAPPLHYDAPWNFWLPPERVLIKRLYGSIVWVTSDGKLHKMIWEQTLTELSVNYTPRWQVFTR